MNKSCLSCRYFEPQRPRSHWGTCNVKLPPKVHVKWPQSEIDGAQTCCVLHASKVQVETRDRRKKPAAAAEGDEP